MKALQKALLLLLTPLLLFSCSSDDNENLINGKDLETVTALLTSHPWKLDQHYLNGENAGLVAPEEEEIPYILHFNTDGSLKSANFTTLNLNEQWAFVNHKLMIEGTPIFIDAITQDKLVLRLEENNQTRKLIFFGDNIPEAFPLASVSGKTYKAISGNYDGKKQTPENNTYLYRTKVLIEENNATMTDSERYFISWEAISSSFVFSKEIGIGFNTKIEDNEDLTMTYYLYDDNTPKSTTIKSDQVDTQKKYTITFSQCELWDFLEGPDWVLQEIRKQDVEITDPAEQPMPIGTIWYFNKFEERVEELTNSADQDPEYMPYEFAAPPTTEDIRINIEVEAGTNIIFKVLKANIAELELEATVEGQPLQFIFAIEDQD